LRIIAGTAKGRRLASFESSVVRPTSDKIREAIFDVLISLKGRSPGVFPYQEVLDIFAGTGSMGIEALSRGASTATFVENNRDTLKVLRKNLHLCGFLKETKIFPSDVLRSLRLLKREKRSFDLIFLDPPYDQGLVEQTIRSVLTNELLESESCIVAEHSLKEVPAEKVDRLKLEKRKKYGATMVSFYTVSHKGSCKRTTENE
jgi:16S rRNA (guanine966-N2)-methyltransferase